MTVPMIDKSKQKELDEQEAIRKGVSYKEIRSERRRKEKTSRRADDNDDEHAREVKRLRTYSHDDNEGSIPSQRPRTRSIDVQKEQAAQITECTALTVDAWRQEHSITIRSHGSQQQKIPDPFRTFPETPFAPAVLQLFQKAGFVTPTAIQAQAWPLAIQQHDLICIAKTGSGSTSFLFFLALCMLLT
jgi:ATP-dependent RNA helicase DDX5/DBP2